MLLTYASLVGTVAGSTDLAPDCSTLVRTLCTTRPIPIGRCSLLHLPWSQGAFPYDPSGAYCDEDLPYLGNLLLVYPSLESMGILPTIFG